MSKFIEHPNLPRKKVSAVICGELCSELNDFLDSSNIERICIEPNNFIDTAVRYHADMAVLHLGSDKIVIDKNQKHLCDVLLKKGFDVSFSETEIKGEYPRDIALNFAVFGNNFLGKLNCADEALADLTCNLNHIPVKQGYAKCSCLIIEENAIITDDESVYKALLHNGTDVLLIGKGDVRLCGHDYGFIGGASGKISQSEILFFGNITKHRDYKKIADFIEKYDCEMKYLDFPLTDFGGIVPIVEED